MQEVTGGLFLKKGIYLNDTIHGLIALTEYEKRVISTIGFYRLHDVYQNSTVYLTFPTNRTKRFEHSIGTMKLCSDMFFHSLLNTSDVMLNEFFNIFELELDRMIQEIAQDIQLCDKKLGGRIPESLPQIKFDQLRHSLIPYNIPAKYRVHHMILMQSIRASALLHDIGHPPFSHIVEFALKDVYLAYKDIKENQTDHMKEFLSVMSKYFEDNKKLHEQMGDEISDGILKKVITPISEDMSLYDENLFEVLVLECVNRIFKEKGAFRYLHRILDSGLDADRLDYVTRDSINSGMDTGKIEYSRIINEMKLIVKNGEIFFCLPLKTVGSVEDFIKRRYNSYKDIIYHHRVIKTDFLLEGIVEELVMKYLNEKESTIPSESEVLIPFDISGLWFPLGNKKSAIKANALSQWNDSWLMTVLKQIYYTQYYHNDNIVEGSKEYVLQQRLTELLRNSKRYYSIIKRSENFKIIDDAVKLELVRKKEELEELLNQVQKLSKEGTLQVEVTVMEAIHEVLENTTRHGSGFVLSFIYRHSQDLQMSDFEQFVREIVKEETNHMFQEIKMYDTVTLFKRISIGLDKPIYFYNHKEAICKFHEISGISDILQLDSDYLPVFYIYILAKNAGDEMKENREQLLSHIGHKIGLKVVRRIRGVLEKYLNEMNS